MAFVLVLFLSSIINRAKYNPLNPEDASLKIKCAGECRVLVNNNPTIIQDVCMQVCYENHGKVSEQDVLNAQSGNKKKVSENEKKEKRGV